MTNHQTFFRSEVPEILSRLKPDQKPKWGEMNASEMVDHILAGMKLFLSKTETELETPAEYLPKYKAFLMSDKGFKPGAKKPLDYRNYESSSLDDLEALKHEFFEQLVEFDKITSTDAAFWSFHPSFGKLNAEETRQLNYKHIRHHFRQFGLMNE